MTIYKNKDNKRLPGVTTILGILNKPQLVAWANNLGLNGIESSKFVDDLANVGTLAHALVHEHLTGKKVDLDEYSKKDIDRAENAVISYFEWEKDKKVKVILAEAQLVSEKDQYGGTCDLYAEINGEKCLIDFKTSKALYDEHMYQVSAYKMLLEENGYPVDKCIIVRIGREATEGFETRTITNFELGQQIFRHCLAIYKLRKEAK